LSENFYSETTKVKEQNGCKDGETDYVAQMNGLRASLPAGLARLPVETNPYADTTTSPPSF